KREQMTEPIHLAFDGGPGLALRETVLNSDSDHVGIQVTAAREAAVGRRNITLRASAGDLQQNATLEVHVLPAGCQLGKEAKLVSDLRQQSYFDHIEYLVGENVPVPFILLPQQSEEEPATCYLMENKVSNDLFGRYVVTLPADHPLREKAPWLRGGLGG